MTKRKLRPPTWLAVSLLSLTAQRPGGLVLAVMVSVDDFVVVAFETSAPSPGSTNAEAAAAIFGSHAHKVIGQGVSLAGGVAIAERYAAAWLVSDEAAALCGCGEIDS